MSFPRFLDVLGEFHREGNLQIQVGERASGALRSAPDMAQKHVGGFGDERPPYPAVGELARQLEIARPERGDVYGDVDGFGARPYRPAFAAGQRKAVRFAAVFETLARRRHADYLNGFARPTYGTGERDAVPSFDHLRTARAESEPKAPVGQRLHRHAGHGEVGGRSAADLDDSRSQRDSPRPRGEVGERGNGVESPRFARPDGFRAQPLRFQREIRRAVPAAARVRSDVDGDFHWG